MLPRIPKPMKPRLTRSLGPAGFGKGEGGKSSQLPLSIRPRPAAPVALWSMKSRRVDFDIGRLLRCLPHQTASLRRVGGKARGERGAAEVARSPGPKGALKLTWP